MKDYILPSCRVWRISGVHSCVDQMEPLYKSDDIVILCRHFIKQYADLLAHSRNGIIIWPRNLTSGELESVCQKYSIAIDRLFKITKI